VILILSLEGGFGTLWPVPATSASSLVLSCKMSIARAPVIRGTSPGDAGGV
jgi:hypothetical protein